MRRFLIAVAVLTVTLPLFATESNPSAHQRELIEKLMDAMNMSANVKSSMDSMFGIIEKQYLDDAAMKGNDPDDVAEAREGFTLFRERASKLDVVGLMQEATIRIYAKYFTESELEDLTAFYASPTGRKSIEVMPHLLREGMEAGVQYVTPKIGEVIAEVRAEQEKRRPWRRTMSDIRSIGSAVESYALDHDQVYPAGDYASLQALLVPVYMKTIPEKDIWGHAYAYAAAPDGSSYRVVSGGSDGNFEWDSRTVAAATKDASEDEDGVAIRYRDRLEDDFIYENGQFLQLPKQAMPKKQHED
jgi:hypothetical protein